MIDAIVNGLPMPERLTCPLLRKKASTKARKGTDRSHEGTTPGTVADRQIVG